MNPKSERITMAHLRAIDSVELLLTLGIKTFIRAVSDDVWRQSVSPYARRLYENEVINQLNKRVSTDPMSNDWLLTLLLPDPDVHENERLTWSATRDAVLKIKYSESKIKGGSDDRQRNLEA